MTCNEKARKYIDQSYKSVTNVKPEISKSKKLTIFIVKHFLYKLYYYFLIKQRNKIAYQFEKFQMLVDSSINNIFPERIH